MWSTVPWWLWCGSLLPGCCRRAQALFLSHGGSRSSHKWLEMLRGTLFKQDNKLTQHAEAHPVHHDLKWRGGRPCRWTTMFHSAQQEGSPNSPQKQKQGPWSPWMPGFSVKMQEF